MLLSLLLGRADATTCYEGLHLPRLVGPQDADKDTFLYAMAGSESLNALFMGGFAESTKFKSSNAQSKSAVVMRLDLD